MFFRRVGSGKSGGSIFSKNICGKEKSITFALPSESGLNYKTRKSCQREHFSLHAGKEPISTVSVPACLPPTAAVYLPPAAEEEEKD